MSQQIRFFDIPRSDLTNENFSFTVIDEVAEDNGQLIADFMRNRNLTSAWMTSGSNDSANTELVADFIDSESISSLFLVQHNLKNFKVEWFDGVTWSLVDQLTDNAESTTEHVINQDGVKKIKVTIYGTMVANDDKRITQFLAMESIGQLVGWPEISNMDYDLGQKSNKMLSGKYSISESVGSTSLDLTVDVEDSQHDLDIYEKLFFLYKMGFVVYLSGGDESQFRVKVKGYRKEDFFVMKPTRDYSTDFYKSLYQSGIKFKASFVEVV